MSMLLLFSSQFFQANLQSPRDKVKLDHSHNNFSISTHPYVNCIQAWSKCPVSEILQSHKLKSEREVKYLSGWINTSSISLLGCHSQLIAFFPKIFVWMGQVPFVINLPVQKVRHYWFQTLFPVKTVKLSFASNVAKQRRRKLNKPSPSWRASLSPDEPA